MINEIMLGGSENTTSVHNSNILGNKLKGASRFKGNALGDVRNTLHSRSNVNTPAGKQVLQKDIFLHKNSQNENAYSIRKETTAKPKSFVDVKNSSISSPELECCDLHNHNLCEQADRAYFDDLMSNYKLGRNEIEFLVARMKPFNLSLPKLQIVPSVEPLEDIEIVECDMWEKTKTSVYEDSIDEFTLPEIKPPETY